MFLQTLSISNRNRIVSQLIKFIGFLDIITAINYCMAEQSCNAPVFQAKTT